MSSELKCANFTKRSDSEDIQMFTYGNLTLYGNDGSVNLTAGAPGPEILEKICAIMAEATKHRMERELQDRAILFQYGPSVGRYDTRKSIAQFLSRQYKDDVNCHDLVLTTGATSGLHLVMMNFIDHNGVVFVDEITFLFCHSAFRLFPNIKVIPIPLTKNGIDVAIFRTLAERHKFESKTKMFWGLYFTVTIYQNPTGMVFAEDVCKEIVDIARENDLLVHSEDVYNLLNYNGGAPPKRLFAYDQFKDDKYKGNVIGSGTFSKYLAPGIRVGWMECPPRCVDAFANLKSCIRSGGATNNYMAGIVATAIDLGLVDKNMKLMSSICKERMEVACKILKENLPKSCEFDIPSGGYFIWVKFPDSVDVNGFVAYTEKMYKVSIFQGSAFCCDNDQFRNCARISISFYTVDVIRAALEQLCKAYKEYICLGK